MIPTGYRLELSTFSSLKFLGSNAGIGRCRFWWLRSLRNFKSVDGGTSISMGISTWGSVGAGGIDRIGSGVQLRTNRREFL